MIESEVANNPVSDLDETVSDLDETADAVAKVCEYAASVPSFRQVSLDDPNAALEKALDGRPLSAGMSRVRFVEVGGSPDVVKDDPGTIVVELPALIPDIEELSLVDFEEFFTPVASGGSSDCQLTSHWGTCTCFLPTQCSYIAHQCGC